MMSRTKRAAAALAIFFAGGAASHAVPVDVTVAGTTYTLSSQIGSFEDLEVTLRAQP